MNASKTLSIIRRVCICEYILNIDPKVGYSKTTSPDLNVMFRELMLSHNMTVKFGTLSNNYIVITIKVD